MTCENYKCIDCKINSLLIDDESDDELYEYEIKKIDIKKKNKNI